MRQTIRINVPGVVLLYRCVMVNGVLFWGVLLILPVTIFALYINTMDIL
jgi:hypothetical protein